MKRTSYLLLAVLASASIAHGARSADGPVVGRYQLGGTERDGLILVDTATGRTWKYSRNAKAAEQEPVWILLRFPEKAAPAAAVPGSEPDSPHQTPAEESWIGPGPYKDKRPGGK